MTNVIQIGKKAFTWSVVMTTIVWSMGIAALAPVVANAATCPTLEAGDLFKVPGNSAVYLLNANLERMYFPHSDVYRTWYEDFSGVVEIDGSCVDAYPAPSVAPFGVNYRPGSRLVKVQISPSVYVVEPGNKISKLGSASVAADLYGANWGGMVRDIADPFWPNYAGRGSELTESTPHDGMFIQVSGASDVWYVDGGEKMRVDGTPRGDVHVVSQAVADRVPNGSGSKTAASVYADPAQGAGGGATPSTPSTPTSQGTLTVALATDTPDGTFAVSNAARVPFTKINFTATGGDVVIKSFKVARAGAPAIDGDFSKINVVTPSGDLLNEAGKSLNSDHEVTFTEDLTIPSGQTMAYTLAADMGSVGGGNVPRLSLLSVETDSTVVGSFPVVGNPVTTNASVTLGTVTLAEGTNIGNSTEQVGETGVQLASVKVTVTNSDFQVERITLNNGGTAADADVQNIRLTYNNNTIATGSLKDKFLSFDLTSCGDDCKILKGKNKTFDVYGDLISGSSRTVNLFVKRATHVLVNDLDDGYYRTATNNAADSDLTNTITISQGKINITKTNDVQTGNIPEDASDLAIGSWNFKVTGEPITINTLVFRLTGTGSTQAADFTNLVLYDAAGNALTGGIDGVGAASVGYATSTDSVTLPPGDNIVTLRATVNSDPATGDTITAAIDMPNATQFDATGEDSGDTITVGTFATPASTVSANTMTIKAGSLRVTTLSTPPATTYAAGTNGVVVAKVQLDGTDSSEDLKFTQLKITLSTNATAIPIDMQNIRIWVDKDGDSFNGSGTLEQLNEVQNGSSSTADTDETITFNLSGTDQFVLKKGKKLVAEFRADIAGGATAGAHDFAVSSSDFATAIGTDTGTQVEEVVDTASGNAITIGASGGQIQVAIDSGNQVARLYAGGTTGAALASFNFLATTTENVEVETLQLTMRETDTSSSSFQDYNLLYLEDEQGNQLGSVVPTSTTPVITFADKAFVVDRTDTDGMIVYLKGNLSNIGTQENVTVGGHALGFNIAAAGDVVGKGALTGAASNEYLSSGSAPNGNTHYMYKAIPTVTKLAVSSGTLVNGTNELFKFRVTANSADIDLYKFSFDIATTTATVTNVEVVDVTDSNEVSLYNQATTGFATGYFEVKFDTDSSGTTAGGEGRVVSKNTPRTYLVRGTVSGASSGASVSTRLGGDAAFFGNGDVAGATSIMNTAENVDTAVHNEFIWSDRSVGAHATTTADWTNGFLVTGLNSASTTPTVLSL